LVLHFQEIFHGKIDFDKKFWINQWHSYGGMNCLNDGGVCHPINHVHCVRMQICFVHGLKIETHHMKRMIKWFRKKNILISFSHDENQNQNQQLCQCEMILIVSLCEETIQWSQSKDMPRLKHLFQNWNWN
jgi:hypothetical protein